MDDPASTGQTLLLVEDNEDNRIIYCTVLRHLGYEVIEKDPDAAYLIFRYATPGQPKDLSTGTVEIVATDTRVKLYVQIPRMPEYHERVLRDGLLKKLREEYGVPPPRTDPKQPPPDAGPDAPVKD